MAHHGAEVQATRFRYLKTDESPERIDIIDRIRIPCDGELEILRVLPVLRQLALQGFRHEANKCFREVEASDGLSVGREHCWQVSPVLTVDEFINQKWKCRPEVLRRFIHAVTVRSHRCLIPPLIA